MKGFGKILYLMIAAVIFAAIISTVATTIVAGNTSFKAEINLRKDTLKAMESLHAVEDCFMERSGQGSVISEKFLRDHQREKIENVCGIESPDIEAYVQDVERNIEWAFPRSFGEEDHSSWVTIVYENGEANMGRLYVKV